MSPPPHGRTRRVDLVRLREKLPASVADVLRQYERHLTLERDLSPHTVRAYVGDAVALLGHVAGNNLENAGSWARLVIASVRREPDLVDDGEDERNGAFSDLSRFQNGKDSSRLAPFSG